MTLEPNAVEADLLIYNANIVTMDESNPTATAVAVKGDRFLAVGSDSDIMRYQGPATRMVDGNKRLLIPGLNDSHIHLIRGGLNYNLELRWDGVPSVADALRMLKQQVDRTPAPHWVRVVGGWTEFQFKERRMPTLEEINRIAPHTPVFILNLYRQAFLNQAALRVVGYTKDSPNPPGGEIQRDSNGNPTGMLIARPNATILYATLAKGPRLSYEDQMNSTRLFMRELNRFGLTSVIDAGGGFQNYPDDYQVFAELDRRGEITVRTAYNLFTQHPNHELEDFQSWTSTTQPYTGSPYYRHNGAGEMLVYSAADFEDFVEPRPELPAVLEDELYSVTHHLVQQRWPFRLHATYGESISRFLDVFERVNKDVPFKDLRWILDHAETIQEKDLERVVALGGAIAVQNRMAFQGEYFVDRYGAQAAEEAPPITKMLTAGLHVGVGTDATRVASYNPWVSLYWLVTGKTLGGLRLYPESNRVDRHQALRMYTAGNAWFSKEEDVKGQIKAGQYADLSLLTDNFFQVAEEEIKGIEAVLTVVGGRIVYGAREYQKLSPPAPKASPDWAPHNFFGGYYSGPGYGGGSSAVQAPAHNKLHHRGCHHHHGSGFCDLDCFVF
ncbi:amidohydrolase [Paenibacillus mucilaginosus]|uniref:Amidohydrolase 3 n=1 Tax=Paenibacillus mucilaginosus (strain KNP414) TaxID=1036673 RepID=F8FRM3_PAEMK|nr:amidohydrolase [Paenibacillus mucilaginosus]AEI40580.1 Amidohydrolase 3 [Paenibacillus mucilaginosus KNP414]MCG7216288.1 amidohydrolase [Paenibacillus mucilaginosus]WDM29734.1 amidohydrolase [Paenibacillus mucilaginosus]